MKDRPLARNRTVFAALLLSGGLTLAFVAGGCTKTAETAPNLAIPVTVAKAVEKTVPVELTSIGSGEPYSTVSIKAQVNATLETVNFKQGDFVKKGDLLFTLDARPFQATLDQVVATLARDKAQAELDEVEAERYEKLYTSGIAPKEQFDTAKATAAAQESAVQADRAAVQYAQLQLEYCKIYAPIDGRTGALQVYPGNLVKQNDVPILVVINQITPLYVDFSVPEQYLGAIKRYTAAGRLEVGATPYGDAKPETGYLTFVDNAVDNTTGTIKLKATFTNGDHRLWPGQYSTVSLRLAEEENATVVPSEAVETGQSGDFVYVVGPDLSADQRAVKVARTIGGESVIAHGVAPGETVVTDGQLRLIPGVKVQIRSDSSGS